MLKIFSFNILMLHYSSAILSNLHHSQTASYLPVGGQSYFFKIIVMDKIALIQKKYEITCCSKYLT